MHRVGTKELKARLSHYLRLVRAGARVVVTDRGNAIAELHPVAEHASRESAERAWVSAAAEGRATLPTEAPRAPRPRRLRGDAGLSDAIREDRR